MSFQLQFDWKVNNQGDFKAVDTLMSQLRATTKLTNQEFNELEKQLTEATTAGKKLGEALRAASNNKFTSPNAKDVISDVIQSMRAAETQVKNLSKGNIELTGTFANMRAIAALTGTDLSSLYGIIGGLNLAVGALSISTIAAGAALAGVGLASAKAAINTGEYAREVTNLSNQLGMSLRQTQLVKGAMEVTGESTQSLIQGFRTLSKAIGEGSDEGRKQQAVLQRLKIDPFDQNGNLKDNMQMMRETYAAISKLQVGPQQNFTMSTLFGREGSEQSKAMKETLQEIENQKSRRLLSDEDIEAAKQFNTELVHIKQMFEDISHIVGSFVIGNFSGIFSATISSLPALAQAIAIAKGLKDFAFPDKISGNLAPGVPAEAYINSLGAAGKAEYERIRRSDLRERIKTDRGDIEAQGPVDPSQGPAAVRGYFSERNRLAEKLRADEKALRDYENMDKTSESIRKFFEHTLMSFENIDVNPVVRLFNRLKEVESDPKFKQLSSGQRGQINAQFDMAANRESISLLGKAADDIDKGFSGLLGEADRQSDIAKQEKGSTLAEIEDILKASRAGSGRFAKGSELPLPIIPADFASIEERQRITAGERAATLRSITVGNRNLRGEPGNPLQEQQQRSTAEIIFAQRAFLEEMQKAQTLTGEDKLQKQHDAEEQFQLKIREIREETEDRIFDLQRKQHAEESAFLQGAVGSLISRNPLKGIENFFLGFARKTAEQVLGNALMGVDLKIPHSDNPLLKGTLFGHDARNERSNVGDVAAGIHAQYDSMDKLTSAIHEGLKVQITVNVAGGGGGVGGSRPSISVTGGPDITVTGGSVSGASGLSGVESVATKLGFGEPMEGSPILGGGGGGGGVPSAFGGGLPTMLAMQSLQMQDGLGGHNVTPTSNSRSPFAIPSDLGVSEYGGKAVTGPNPHAGIGASGILGGGLGIVKGLGSIFSKGSLGKGGFIGKNLGNAAAIGGGIFQAIKGFGGHGVGGITTAASGIAGSIGGIFGMLSTIAPVLGPFAPILEGIGLIGSIIGGLFGTSRAHRKDEIDKTLRNSAVLDRLPMSFSQGLGGGYSDFDSTGMPRGSNLSPFPQINQPAFGADLNGQQTVIPGQQMSAFGGGDIHLNLSAIDTRSGAEFLSNHQDHLTELLRQALTTGNGISLANAMGANIQ